MERRKSLTLLMGWRGAGRSQEEPGEAGRSREKPGGAGRSREKSRVADWSRVKPTGAERNRGYRFQSLPIKLRQARRERTR